MGEEGKIIMGALEKEKIKVKRRVREAVTGDPEERVRDHMKKVPQVFSRPRF